MGTNWLFGYLNWPRTILLVSLLLMSGSIYYVGLFRFDASADTLVVEGDEELATYDRIAATFGGDDFLFLTFQPNNRQPISPPELAVLEQIVEDLQQIDGVRSVFSVLDAPLLKSPPMSLAELEDGFRTLNSADVDFALARQELVDSPFFRELLITADGSATAIKIDLAADTALVDVTARRDALRKSGQRSGEQWASVSAEYREVREAYLLQREKLISDVRAVQSKYADAGTLHLGGVPMIAADMITYVKRDLTIFGGLVLGLMIAALALFFRHVRWVVLPILTAGLSVLYTVGLLGLLDWQATVISSNFISLLGITTISLTIHLIVHYRELLHARPELDLAARVAATMRDKLAPCFFTALTTMAAFGSLTASGIVPVEDFGWMMCMGILLSFFATYTFFPAVLLLMKNEVPSGDTVRTNHFIRVLGELTRWHPVAIVVISSVLSVLAYIGIQKVSLDNRFAEYFDTETEIYQGMHYIDQQLGGTIPFDVVLSFPPFEDEVLDEDDDFFFEDEEEADPYPERYWFSRSMLDRLEKVHRYLAAAPQVGKVLSFTALEDFAREFNDGEKLSSLEIVAVLGAIPPHLHEQLIAPYASPRTGQLRLSGRIIESGSSFDREEFRQQIIAFGVDEVSFIPDQVEVTGMMVLFNSMLQQLLNSQIGTLKYVLIAVFVMFLVLLRSLTLAVIGMVPNILAAAMVVGAMGYAGIPLDMMTTTIAAICIGIGVDDTIHYLHRFRLEYARWGDARVAVSFSHASIGRALYFTSVTVIVGFSVLYFSNFVPTVLFGLWTAVAMILALTADLALLPALLVLTHAKRPPDPTVRTDVAF
jgi:predicted RND superfamily exporter protein